MIVKFNKKLFCCPLLISLKSANDYLEAIKTVPTLWVVLGKRVKYPQGSDILKVKIFTSGAHFRFWVLDLQKEAMQKEGNIVL